MTLLFRQKREQTAADLVSDRGWGLNHAPTVTADTALRASAVWACLRLRADLISTLPVDVFRMVDGIQVSVPTPPVLVEPDGDWDVTDWLYASQVDLDRFGNAMGVITEFDGAGRLPKRVELLPFEAVTGKVSGTRIVEVRCNGEVIPRDKLWHERQFPLAGFPLGLSPISYAAYSVGSYLSAQQFGLNWFSNGSIPSGHFRNTAKVLKQGEAAAVKERFKVSVNTREPLVTGNDWEFNAISVAANESQFLETIKAQTSDIARYLGVPGDMIDAETSTGSITYASVTQRNLQLLITNLNPAVVRRERALSRWTAKPRFVKLNTDALLRMDPQTRSEMFASQIASRQRVPSEVRALDNLPPFTAEQEAELARLLPSKPVSPVKGVTA